jgi:hypothetical protein
LRRACKTTRRLLVAHDLRWLVWSSCSSARALVLVSLVSRVHLVIFLRYTLYGIFDPSQLPTLVPALVSCDWCAQRIEATDLSES